jgi:hypothetical protein
MHDQSKTGRVTIANIALLMLILGVFPIGLALQNMNPLGGEFVIFGFCTIPVLLIAAVLIVYTVYKAWRR